LTFFFAGAFFALAFKVLPKFDELSELPESVSDPELVFFFFFVFALDDSSFPSPDHAAYSDTAMLYEVT
jgi:hypothetical protein